MHTVHITSFASRHVFSAWDGALRCGGGQAFFCSTCLFLYGCPTHWMTSYQWLDSGVPRIGGEGIKQAEYEEGAHRITP